jgi:hypothetical protein
MTEHAAGIFVFFFLGEYASIILICILITIILLGGYDILIIIYFLEKIIYFFILILSTLAYVMYMNILFFKSFIESILEVFINNSIFDVNTDNFYQLNNLYTKYNFNNDLNLLYKFYNIKDNFQFSNNIFIIFNDYNNYI